MKVTLVYSALLVFVFLFLSIRIIRLRRSLKIGVGDSGNKQMVRAMRVHSNFAEYVPLTLLMLYFLENQNVSSYLIHFLGISLVLGRISHAYGMSQEIENFKFRIAGMAVTFTILFICSIYLLWIALVQSLL